MATAPADLSTPALQDEVCTLAAHIHAATARLLALVAELDRREAWDEGGCQSAGPRHDGAARQPSRKGYVPNNDGDFVAVGDPRRGGAAVNSRL